MSIEEMNEGNQMEEKKNAKLNSTWCSSSMAEEIKTSSSDKAEGELKDQLNSKLQLRNRMSSH